MNDEETKIHWLSRLQETLMFATESLIKNVDATISMFTLYVDDNKKIVLSTPFLMMNTNKQYIISYD